MNMLALYLSTYFLVACPSFLDQLNQYIHSLYDAEYLGVELIVQTTGTTQESNESSTMELAWHKGSILYVHDDYERLITNEMVLLVDHKEKYIQLSRRHPDDTMTLNDHLSHLLGSLTVGDDVTCESKSDELIYTTGGASPLLRMKYHFDEETGLLNQIDQHYEAQLIGVNLVRISFENYDRNTKKFIHFFDLKHYCSSEDIENERSQSPRYKNYTITHNRYYE